MKFYVIPNNKELDKYLKLSNDYNLGFEYNDFYDPNLLDDELKLNNLIEKYKKLNRKNDTMHGVFYDINLASADNKIRKISEERIIKSLDIAKTLNLKGVVFHTNYETWIKDKKYRDNWVNLNYEFYKKMLDKYEDIEIYIENMFDLNPILLKELMDRFNSNRIGVCLDFSHAAISGLDLDIWFNTLKKYIKHIHINDNDLIKDSHEEIGKGKIDFKLIFDLISELDDVSILIEIKDYNKTLNSINYLKDGDYFDFK